MRPRTFILVILVFVLIAVAAVLIYINLIGNGGDGNGDTAGDTPTGETGEGPITEATPIPPTPALRLETVVIARVDLPVGTRLTMDLLELEQRPNTNIALQGSYHFATIEELEGRITRVDIQKGDAVLAPMVALQATDLATFGSDLSLYVDRGKVAVAFPVNERSGAAFAMRPGDMVDIMMTASVIDLDPDFKTALPNVLEILDQLDLFSGLFFPPIPQGRLEFIEEFNQIIHIVPKSDEGAAADSEEGFGRSIPKRVTQLTIQQAEVLWIGTWQDRQQLEREQAAASEEAATGIETEAVLPTPTPLPERNLSEPFLDVVILSMPTQDAIALKWAFERGLDIDLALRAQGDIQSFVTTSVSLFEIVEQEGLLVPQLPDFDLQPRADELLPPSLPSIPGSTEGQ
jgi:Flp pilus assembly protein CpaB